VAAGGAPAGGAPAGGDASGGLAAVAGAGGAGDEVPLECAEPADDCESCYLAGCCDEYVACVNDDGNDGSGDCSQQFFDILACKDELRSTQDVLPADLKQCALDEVEGGSVWSADLRPAVKPLIDCLAGMAGWENMPWTDSSCNNTCFKQTE
jgi:hypothetical protein